LTVLYHQANKGHLAKKPVDLEGKKKNIVSLKEQLGE